MDGQDKRCEMCGDAAQVRQTCLRADMARDLCRDCARQRAIRHDDAGHGLCLQDRELIPAVAKPRVPYVPPVDCVDCGKPYPAGQVVPLCGKCLSKQDKPQGSLRDDDGIPHVLTVGTKFYGPTTSPKDHGRLERMTRGNGHDRLGGGIHRAGYAVSDDLVIKVAHDPDSVESNEDEVNVWKLVKGTKYEKYFCPIVAYDPGFRWVAMTRCEMRDKHAYDHDYLFEFTARINYGDDHNGNWGLLGSRAVLTDYTLGIFGGRAKLERMIRDNV